eukprot:CAMPEP_0177265860 /NCGR_PEP_ID=MMETSP0367-20130122/62354_1 /TAXON_ID=447022 ORGANISM="Scrippsiella hangoei-like, Strain SHHI-4" /NCGR_SAMPLE_ID=MMETSP0367 /ASSEMBLY_ACC=CAM_ASM_000362 /LENGTH=49 /DNA_ID=CAMNT_0018721147 /DNA_START=1 /DNA_END=150 /DNA_ORIENTATION=-
MHQRHPLDDGAEEDRWRRPCGDERGSLARMSHAGSCDEDPSTEPLLSSL